jgi:SAM-dependent methyltransferase
MVAPLTVRNDVRACLRDYFSRFLKPGMKVYDVGCGDKPFQKFLDGKVESYIGVDIEDGFYDASHIDLVGSAYAVPAPDGAADAVISSQVLEHLERPEDALKEASRLLRPDGFLFISFPFLYPIHALPNDYLRYTRFYFDAALVRHGFAIVERKTIGGFWYCCGVFSGLYLQSFDRGLLKQTGLVRGLIFLLKLLFCAIHSLEGAAFDLTGRDKDDFRLPWAVNYVYVARRKEN